MYHKNFNSLEFGGIKIIDLIDKFNLWQSQMN